MRLKSHLVASYHDLVKQEAALKVTTLTSLVEFTICTMVATALGIFAYIEGSSRWSTIAGYVLFGFVLVYETSGVVAYLIVAKVNVAEEDYRRLMMEARKASAR
jgi:hypothetical protein